MSDRKYRQRGYQDSDRPERDKKARPPKPEIFGPRTPKLPGSHSVSRCGGCGTVLAPDVDPQGKCPRCGFELHSCKQCAYFDASARFECTQPVLVRIPRKDAKNECRYFAMRVTIEKQTKLPQGESTRPDDPRTAFENLFKK